MKVTHISTTDIKGGAARAAYRLHRGLIETEVNSQMLVQVKHSRDPTVEAVYADSKIGKLCRYLRPLTNRLLQKLQKTSNPVYHSANFLPSGLHKRINNSDADVIHLHWVGGEMISVKEISKVKKPLVWTLHDMWAFSGTEHYDDLQFSGRAKKGYTKDNRPRTYYGLDLDRWIWQKKKKYWQNKKFHLVAPSSWLEKCINDSALFNNKSVQKIPYGLNLNVYKPIPKRWARQILNIRDNNNVRYILFGAIYATNDSRKGYKELMKALLKLAKSDREKHYELLIFGSEGHNSIDFGFPTTYLGYLNDDETLALAYSAADIMAVPSLQDNLPNTAIEATACGTPVAAFSTGGLPDIVDHKKNGYLAEPYKAEDLANGIEWLLETKERIEKLSENARKKAINTFSLAKIAGQYLKLYNQILEKDDSCKDS